MEETVHGITTKMRQSKKSTTWTNKEEVEGSFNLTKPGNNTMHTFFIILYLSLVEIWKVCWMREITDQQYKICTKLVGRHNTSSLMMFQYWVMVVVFQDIFSFMIPIKNIKCYHVHMWEAIQVKRVTKFCSNHGLLPQTNRLKHLLKFQ